MKVPDIKELLIDDSPVSDDDFRRQNLVNVIGSIIFMIAGPLFIYQGFYLLTWPYTVKWGALAIALGFFGTVLWIQSLAGPGGAGPAGGCTSGMQQRSGRSSGNSGMNEKSRKNEHGCVFSLREIVGWDLRPLWSAGH